MFRKRRDVRLHEEYRLIESVEKARKSLYNIQKWRLFEEDDLTHIPILLSELRYRYLLRQARQRQMMNRWYYDNL